MHFVIASPRTGATHLTLLLNMRDDILCNELRRRDPDMFLQRILDHDCGRKHVGFKILPKHNDEALEKIVSSRSVKKGCPLPTECARSLSLLTGRAPDWQAAR